MNEQEVLFRRLLVRLMADCQKTVPDDDKHAHLSDARYLASVTLFRALGVKSFLGDNEKKMNAIDIRWRIHDAFGAPGNWGGAIEDTLRGLYGLDLDWAKSAVVPVAGGSA